VRPRDTVNILLVDDQPAKLMSYEAVLGELGETLLKANSATEALEVLLKYEVAVVLVDVCMPDFDGYELASMIRQHPRFQRTSIIFVSAILMTDLDRLRGYECGGVDYVPVPVVPELLRAKVSVFADLYRKTRALERLNDDLETRVRERTTALEATTAALRAADRRKDEFLAVLAHELRNPLAPIRTAAQLLRRSNVPLADSVRAREIIERQVEHLARLIDDLVDVARITRDALTLSRSPLSIAGPVAEAVEVIRPLMAARRHQFSVHESDEDLIVDGDATRLVQILGNALQNAAKFTPAGGQIVLRVEREEREVVVTVTDTGIGIPPERLSSVFDLFTQSDRGHGGLGIGLALMRRLTELHEGTVTVHSAGPGHGTTVVIRLPLLRSSIDSPPVAQPNAEPTVSRRILVADDNKDAASALAMFLTLLGHDVRVVHDGLDALTVAAVFEPDVVLLDLGMPHMDGCDTARQMRREPWGTRATLVAVTGWGQPEDRVATANAGFDVHLVKPVDETQLFRVIVGDRAMLDGDARSNLP